MVKYLSDGSYAPDQDIGSDKVAPGGLISSNNTTTEILDAAGTFSGKWEVNDFEQVCVNGKTDQDGEYIVSFGVVKDGVDLNGPITDDDVVVTFTGSRPVYAGTGFIRPLVKLAGRAFKVDYVNGGTAQTDFALQTSYGNSMFPISSSDENDILVKQKEERDVFVAIGSGEVTTTKYVILIDLSDTTNFPHDRMGRIDLTNTYLSVDRDQNGTGVVQFGVITRIDGTDADITYVQGIGFEKSDTREIIRDRKISPSALKMGVVDGKAIYAMSSFKATNVTAVNTGVALDSPLGTATVTPAVGDIVASFVHSAGTYTASISATYHSEYTATS